MFAREFSLFYAMFIVRATSFHWNCNVVLEVPMDALSLSGKPPCARAAGWEFLSCSPCIARTGWHGYLLLCWLLVLSLPDMSYCPHPGGWRSLLVGPCIPKFQPPNRLHTGACLGKQPLLGMPSNRDPLFIHHAKPAVQPFKRIRLAPLSQRPVRYPRTGHSREAASTLTPPAVRPGSDVSEGKRYLMPVATLHLAKWCANPSQDGGV